MSLTFQFDDDGPLRGLTKAREAARPSLSSVQTVCRYTSEHPRRGVLGQSTLKGGSTCTTRLRSRQPSKTCSLASASTRMLLSDTAS